MEFNEYLRKVENAVEPYTESLVDAIWLCKKRELRKIINNSYKENIPSFYCAEKVIKTFVAQKK
jgi:hypothetical protein